MDTLELKPQTETSHGNSEIICEAYDGYHPKDRPCERAARWWLDHAGELTPLCDHHAAEFKHWAPRLTFRRTWKLYPML